MAVTEGHGQGQGQMDSSIFQADKSKKFLITIDDSTDEEKGNSKKNKVSVH